MAKHIPTGGEEARRSLTEVKTKFGYEQASELTERDLLLLTAHYTQALFRLAVAVIVVNVVGAGLLYVALQAVEDAAGSGF